MPATGAAPAPINAPQTANEAMQKKAMDAEVSITEILLRGLPFLLFVAVIFFALPTHTQSVAGRVGYLVLLLLLGVASIAAWVRTSPRRH